MFELEKEVEWHLRDAVKARKGLCLKWVCPGWAGVPDRIILLPGGRIVFAELKRPHGGVLAARQVWWKNTLRGLGFRTEVVWSKADADALIRSIDEEGADEV